MFHANAEGSDSGARRVGFGPFEQRRPGFTSSRRSKGQISGIRPLGRLEVSTSRRSSSVQAFSETSFRLLCPLLTSAPRSGRLATTSVPRDTTQISRGKTDRLHRTPAGFTTPIFDDRGLRDHVLARPTG